MSVPGPSGPSCIRVGYDCVFIRQVFHGKHCCTLAVSSGCIRMGYDCVFIRQVFSGKLCRSYHSGVLEWDMIVFIGQVFSGKLCRSYHLGVLEWNMIVCLYGRCFLVNSADCIIRVY